MKPAMIGAPESAMLRPLTRAELDALLADAEHAFTKARVALSNCPLVPETVQGFAAVAGDCLTLWQLALDESIFRMWHGENLVTP